MGLLEDLQTWTRQEMLSLGRDQNKERKVVGCGMMGRVWPFLHLCPEALSQTGGTLSVV